ncbi:MAG TPA: formylmethanofuran dehydrogenase subunit C [Anaerolineaceae bacterium]|nr:formylmethanofuran dehydrogenase subunit C [Anaerolineaceae bacterium]
MTTLHLKFRSNFPLDTESITPDQFKDKPVSEIARLPALLGNQAGALGDFFTIMDDSSPVITLEGDLGRVKHIGAGMTEGKIVIHGNAGMHLGAGMRGGEITVHGDTGDWAGAEMTGGKIHITGNAGHGLGGAYRGSRHGMNRGLILVEGNAGNETGALMRRGLIVVLGNVADFAGAFMLAGTILVFGKLGARTGAGMKYGTIVTFHQPELLATFHYDCVYRPGFLSLLFKSLRSQGLPVEAGWAAGSFRRYSGDFNTLGKGEVLVYAQDER